MRVGLLTQWYDPEPGPAALPGVLARGLRARGHEVQVLTGFPNYPTGVLADGYTMSRRLDERLDDIDVRRVALYANHDASAVRRFANYASFGASATAFGVGALRGLDALWVNYSPITVAWPMWAARFRLRIPSVVHVLDLWPDTVFAGGFASGGRLSTLLEKGLGAWCRGMYAAASSVAYISPGVGRVLQDRGVPQDKLHYVPMWADEQVFHPSDGNLRAELGIAEDQVVLLYAGALGEAQGLSTLIDACAKVDDPRFVCVIAGSGVAESALRAQAVTIGADNVRFVGRLPQEQMTQLMATGDLNYVGLRTHALSPVTMPSKTQAALAAGRAILVAAEGDVAGVVRESGAGFTAHPEDVAGIADAISAACRLGRPELHRLGAIGRDYYERTFSVDQGVTRIEALLQRAASRRNGR
ncbi:glycosyltransferase family 4 protein [Microlunatus panaciterrae]|uniref:Glycosyltransferase involved in cell wall biosynthesis n=1 Tax=Microlunatus panaciterrae TaxID=400768 RepID=A0ABS2RHR3_9ACTN|nr:glycosyltransferase family 4 protein [Microlunatus panaciterrae]MBM7798538.1 glycosyltransferase involved in cell wall biosynthesis [Microlunatus panaciterrae]